MGGAEAQLSTARFQLASVAESRQVEQSPSPATDRAFSGGLGLA